MGVKVKSFRGIRNDASCQNCGWDISIYGDKNGLNEIRKHVRKTGHTVARTYGSEFIYTKEK